MWSQNDAELTASCDVAASQGLLALGADEIEPPEVVPLAKRLLFTIRTFNRKEFGRYYGIAILSNGVVRLEMGRVR